MADKLLADSVGVMSFAAIVFTTLAVVILVLIALGLWSRRRPSDIWEEDVVRSSAARASIEQRDVEEILGRDSSDPAPPDTQGGEEGIARRLRTGH